MGRVHWNAGFVTGSFSVSGVSLDGTLFAGVSVRVRRWMLMHAEPDMRRMDFSNLAAGRDDLAGLALSGVNPEDLRRTVVRIRCAASTWVLEERCRGRI
jgi:hypothetical protein